MNVSEFLNYRKNCPFCDTLLITKFRSSSYRVNTVKIEDDRFVARFHMRDIYHTRTDHKVTYSFSMIGDSFYIEFSKNGSPDGEYINKVPINILKQFERFNNSLGPYCLYRQCPNNMCKRYKYESANLKLDLKSGMANIKLSEECYSYLITVNNQYRNIIHNNRFDLRAEQDYLPSCASIFFWDDNGTKLYETLAWPVDDDQFPIESGEIVMPYIPFISDEQTSRRINSLLIFT